MNTVARANRLPLTANIFEAIDDRFPAIDYFFPITLFPRFCAAGEYWLQYPP